ncbi:hypothetical protein BR93DRAFT_536681 [Coniochaeta sp. PMI_546]|nr:hypothetical protein BR93DRAFT_536681 [Coniochaeta sp. PMI_546]
MRSMGRARVVWVERRSSSGTRASILGQVHAQYEVVAKTCTTLTRLPKLTVTYSARYMTTENCQTTRVVRAFLSNAVAARSKSRGRSGQLFILRTVNYSSPLMWTGLLSLSSVHRLLVTTDTGRAWSPWRRRAINREWPFADATFPHLEWWHRGI